MSSKLRSRLTYANVIATLALFIALGGGAYAAIKLPKNSVGSKQIKKSAVSSSKVKDGSLAALDFKAGQLPSGPQGPKGDAGPTGPAGAHGTDGAPGTPATALFASVSLDATVRTGTATGAGHDGLGLYNVTFGRDVTNCSAVATQGNNLTVGGGQSASASLAAYPGYKFGGGIRSSSDANASHTVAVLMEDAVQESASGAPPARVDTAFHIAVFC